MFFPLFSECFKGSTFCEYKYGCCLTACGDGFLPGDGNIFPVHPRNKAAPDPFLIAAGAEDPDQTKRALLCSKDRALPVLDSAGWALQHGKPKKGHQVHVSRGDGADKTEMDLFQPVFAELLGSCWKNELADPVFREPALFPAEPEIYGFYHDKEHEQYP